MGPDGTVEYLSAEEVKCYVDAPIVLGRQEAFFAARLFSATPPGRCKNRGLCVPLVSYMEPNVTNEEFLEEIHVLWDWSQEGQGGAQTDLGRAVADSGDRYRGMGRV